MTDIPLSILNIGLDRDLLPCGKNTEAQTRQIFYARRLPARLVHLVKAPHGSFSERFNLDDNLSVVPCPARHWTQFIFTALRRGAELLNSEHFNLIQVQEPFVSGLVGAHLAHRFRLPLVVGLYGDEIDNPAWLVEHPLNRLGNLSAKWVLRHAAASRTDSRAVAERLGHYGFRHLTYIPFLITHAEQLLRTVGEASAVRERLLAGMASPLLLAVCRLEQEKNIPLMLQALHNSVKHHPGIVLAIAGHGSLMADLTAAAERLVPGRVRWLGWVANTELPAYYQAADLTLLSSDRESAARVLTESLLAGTPVLTTDTAGAREIIEDGVTGCIVPVGDVNAFARSLSELCGQPDRLISMGRAGRCQMSERVTAEVVARQLRQLYERALEFGDNSRFG